MTVSGVASEKPNDTSLSLYRAIWRWHFFAGLLVIPFMLNLAVTGGLYLFKDEIDNTVFAYRNVVQPRGEALAPSLMVENAKAAVAGSKRARATALQLNPRSPPGLLSAPMPAKLLSSSIRTADRCSAKVGETDEFNWVVKKIHSLDYFGFAFNRIVEAVGGLALILVVTGFYLWWPRKQTGGVISVRGTPDKRVFWRDIHAVTGAVAGALIFFLAITGMPWSGYWGDKFNATLVELPASAIQRSSGMMSPFRTVPTKDVLTIKPAGLSRTPRYRRRH